MITIDKWTGREARALRETLRMSQREFADYLGVAIRTIAQWDSSGAQITPRPEFQRLLDVALARAGEDVRHRFDVAVSGPRPEPSRAGAPRSGQQPAEQATVVIRYPETDADTISAVSEAWASDLAEPNPESTTAAIETIDSAAWHEFALRWTVSSPEIQETGVGGSFCIGMEQVDAVKATVDVFAQLDNRFGGNHARRSLIQFLATDARRLLSARFDDKTRRALYSAIAEGVLLAGWMAYDAGHHLRGQRYLLYALRLAEEGGDTLLAASALSAMSHQATFLGHGYEAADLAQAALGNTRGSATATLTAQFLAMQGRAYARLGDTRRCVLSLTQAERLFDRRRPDDDPAFISYFTEAELAAEIGHCMRDLKQPTTAEGHCRTSLASAEPDSVRSDFFVTLVLADAQLDRGELEQACETALEALQLGCRLRSARAVAYVAEFRARMDRFADTAAAHELSEGAAEYPLWLAANYSGHV